MSAGPSTGSPTLRRTPAPKSASLEENVKVGKEDHSAANDSDGPTSLKKSVAALSTSSLVNQSCPKRTKLNHEPSGPLITPEPYTEPNPMDKLLAQLSQQQSGVPSSSEVFRSTGDENAYPVAMDHNPTTNSVPITPATEIFGSNSPSVRSASATMNDNFCNNDEVVRLKQELAQARNKISSLGSELAQTRYDRPAPAPLANSPIEVDFTHQGHSVPRAPGRHPTSTINQQHVGREAINTWPAFDDSRSDTSEALSAGGFRPRSVWGGNKQALGTFVPGSLTPELLHHAQWSDRGANQGYVDPNVSFESTLSATSSTNFRGQRLTPDYDLTVRAPGNRRNGRFDSRFAAPGYGQQPGYGNGYNNYGPTHYETGPAPNGPHGDMSGGMYNGYHPSPIGTPLSALASEFTSAGGPPWKAETNAPEGQTYLPSTEPMNYRRLLDKSVNCDWKYIVDKIVCNNDQQASIFLQQKLKVGTPDQKYEIVEAIVAQAYPLMVNRFGNFLVQRCFEHGTPEQVIKIAEAIRGCTLNLSMDPFGCHVVQKAFDSVPEDYKAIMVHELLRRIPETVIHRYACHVWQKLFELRWTESPPQIMRYVNDALRGMWHEVALGETGSLVVQNIFENCLEDDKRPCIEEVLGNIDIVAHGQFGNWCIQHICEHGAPADRSRAIDHVIRFAAEYSMDQYASKVVEKCLKIGGAEFLSRYLDRVCEGRMDRPRIPLIDIASDQYGNYLIQWILTQAGPQHRDVVAAHIRKHMVSLRGSKFGSRVGMLCTNPAVATRPGPGIGTGLGRLPAGPRYSGRAYQ
ncbi:armadillo-type protein [Xylariaceae sp. FL0016]|nr:armadillo-type protein [Xylariaceae sp. FL0016]